MVRVYLGVGSNLGDRRSHLEAARKLVERIPRTRFLRSSSVRETDPVGGPVQGKFLNSVWEINSELSPRELKERLQEIEVQLGRRRREPNAPREIDLDLLFYGEAIVDEERLKIPHPRLHERRFVLEPLAELAPEWIHPKLKKTIKILLTSLRAETQK